jgi:WD40 repeat protein
MVTHITNGSFMIDLKFVKSFDANVPQLRQLCASPVQSVVALRSYSQSSIYEWNLERDDCRAVRSGLAGPIGIAYDDAGELIVVDRLYPALAISLYTGQAQPVPLMSGKNFFEASISPRRSLVALVGGRLAALTDYRSGEDIVLSAGAEWDIDLVALSNTGEQLAMVSRGHSLVLWDVTDVKSPRIVARPTFPQEITGVAFDSQDKRLFLGHLRGSVSTFDLETGEHVQLLSTGSKASVSALLWEGESRCLLVADWKGMVYKYC